MLRIPCAVPCIKGCQCTHHVARSFGCWVTSLETVTAGVATQLVLAPALELTFSSSCCAQLFSSVAAACQRQLNPVLAVYNGLSSGISTSLYFGKPSSKRGKLTSESLPVQYIRQYENVASDYNNITRCSCVCSSAFAQTLP